MVWDSDASVRAHQGTRIATLAACSSQKGGLRAASPQLMLPSPRPSTRPGEAAAATSGEGGAKGGGDGGGEGCVRLLD